MKKKIAIIFPSFELLGAQRVMADYSMKLYELGHSVTIYSGGDGELKDELSQLPIKYFFKKYKSKSNKVYRLVKGIVTLGIQLFYQKYDIIISFAPFQNRVLCLLKLTKIFNCKLILEDHAYPPLSNYEEFKNPLVRLLFFKSEYLYNYADTLKVLTRECEDYYQKKLKNVKIKIFPNLLDFTRIENLLSNQHHLIKKRKRIVSLGRLVNQKNLFFLVDTFSKIEQKEEYELLVIGNGYLEHTLKKYVKDKKIQNILFIDNSIYNYSILKSADVFVICSYWEGLVLTVIEAMYLEVPVVASYFEAGLSFQIGINEKRGYISAMGDQESFSKKIIHVLNDQNTKEIADKVNSAKKFVLEQFCIRKNFNNYIDIILND